MEKVYIASDHAGWDLKDKIKNQFTQYEWIDLGTHNGKDSVDYPDFASELCWAMESSPNSKGVLVCGSGQGMAIRANKYSWIRAALVWSLESTTLSRQHNNANVLCVGARLIPHEIALQCISLFLTTPFEGGRHQKRVDQLSKSTSSKRNQK